MSGSPPFPPTADCFILSASLMPIPVNEGAVRSKSRLLDRLMQDPLFQEKRILQLNLQTPNSDLTLRKAMDFAATGELNMAGSSMQDLMMTAEKLEMSELQEMINRQMLPKPEPLPVPSIFPMPMFNPFLAQFSQLHFQQNMNFLTMMTRLQLMNQPIPEVSEERVCKKKRAEMKKATSMDCDQEPFDNLGDVIIPSSDKEGWCRNKKYIEKTENGFMCTVCRKIYGRYNSVSYHVTIYHRNPPIKCDLPGCQFTTREARYIHFHKYYRHGVPLPQTIDQGTRRCPYCRHVSKSPAMLDKHIKRHQAAETNDSDSLAGSNELIVVDDEKSLRDRTQSISSPEQPMDIQMEEELVKSRALTM